MIKAVNSEDDIRSSNRVEDTKSFLSTRKTTLSADVVRRRETMRARQLRIEEMLSEQRSDASAIRDAQKAINIIDAALQAGDE